MPPTLKLSSKPDLHRYDSLIFQLSTEKSQIKPQLNSLCMVSTPHKSPFNPNCYNDHYNLYASKQLAPYDYRTVKILHFARKFSTTFCISFTYWLVESEFLSCDEKTCPAWDIQNFGQISLPASQKTSSFKTEGLPFHFHYICSIIWKQHVELAHCNFIILWKNTVYLLQRFCW